MEVHSGVHLHLVQEMEVIFLMRITLIVSPPLPPLVNIPILQEAFPATEASPKLQSFLDSLPLCGLAIATSPSKNFLAFICIN